MNVDTMRTLSLDARKVADDRGAHGYEFALTCEEAGDLADALNYAADEIERLTNLVNELNTEHAAKIEAFR